MCVCMCVCMYVCVYICVYVLCVCMYVLCICMYYVCVCVCMYVGTVCNVSTVCIMYVCMYICMNVYMYVCMCICMYYSLFFCLSISCVSFFPTIKYYEIKMSLNSFILYSFIYNASHLSFTFSIGEFLHKESICSLNGPLIFLNRTWISTHIPHSTQARGTGLEITAMYKQLFNDTLNTFSLTVGELHL